ncbi:MAG: methylmalonyl Co-A mutase-associated GTPase MeaB, partial [Armatimonadota bacterium]|nr:methylmalonyl Co-A mutase-associated GTPase MeaB [Armatimonadota bacterium]
LRGEGVGEVLGAIHGHRAYLEAEGLLAIRRRERRKAEILRALQTRISEEVVARARADGTLEALVEAVAEGRLDPHTAAISLLRGI